MPGGIIVPSENIVNVIDFGADPFGKAGNRETCWLESEKGHRERPVIVSRKREDLPKIFDLKGRVIGFTEASSLSNAKVSSGIY